MCNGIEVEILDYFALFERVLKWILFLFACYFLGENYFIYFFNFIWSKLDSILIMWIKNIMNEKGGKKKLIS